VSWYVFCEGNSLAIRGYCRVAPDNLRNQDIRAGEKVVMVAREPVLAADLYVCASTLARLVGDAAAPYGDLVVYTGTMQSYAEPIG
jgi:hypothetical protein